MNAYQEFLAKKHLIAPRSGFDPGELSPALFPFQADLVRWACRRGKAAIFSGTGTGKSLMSLEWAHRVNEREGCKILVLAPLAVAAQTVREADKFGIAACYAREMGQVTAPIVVTNYEMIDRFSPADFGGVVVDEASILKAHDGATRAIFTEVCSRMPYRLSASATPAPNDFMELGSQSEFLGVLTRSEMLATFFVHDGGETQTWRLKGHAQDAFWEWICSWAAMVRMPADLGYPNGKFELPPLHIHQHAVPIDHLDMRSEGMLFVDEARGLTEQRAVRRASLEKRVAATAALVNASADPWIVWGALNDETDALAKAIPGSVNVQGSDSREEKEERLLGFAEGKYRVLVSKTVVAGAGLNLQVCAHQAFCGLGNSWEQWYQAIRRSYRFGQTREVNIHVIVSEADGAVVKNLERKEADAQRMADEMGKRMAATMRREVQGARRELASYRPKVAMEVPSWLKSA